MSETQFDVQYAAQLARMNLTPDEIETFQGQLGQIIGYIEKLNRLDVSGIDPTAHTFPVTNVLREDVSRRCFEPSDALANAPRQANDLFVVTKVVE